MALVIRVKAGEPVIIGENIMLTVEKGSSSIFKLVFKAPKEIRIRKPYDDKEKAETQEG